MTVKNSQLLVNTRFTVFPDISDPDDDGDPDDDDNPDDDDDPDDDPDNDANGVYLPFLP